jgi:hypothetical protein
MASSAQRSAHTGPAKASGRGPPGRTRHGGQGLRHSGANTSSGGSAPPMRKGENT